MACLNCYDEIGLSNRGRWKAMCLECVQQKAHEAVLRAAASRDSSSRDSSSGCSCVDACCRECNGVIGLSNAGMWKALCLECAQSKTDETVSRAVELVREDQEQQYAPAKACCRDCNDIIEVSNKGMWKAFCLDCAEGRKKTAVARAEGWRDSELCSRAVEMASLCARLAVLELELQAKEREMEDRDDRRRGEIAALNAALCHKNALLAQEQQDRETERRYFERGIAMLQERERELEDREERRRGEVATLNAALCRKNTLLEQEQQERITAEHEIAMLQERERELEDQEERRRSEVAALNAALSCKNLLVSQEQHARLQERWSSQREIAALKRTHEEHLRTCPAPKNRLMLEQGETTTFADVCVAVGQTVFHVHRAILASRSPVFASMLNLPMREGKEKLIQIEDMSAGALEEFLFFLYTGHFREAFDAKELCTEVLAAAHKYDVKDMEETLQQLMDPRPRDDLTRNVDEIIGMLGGLPLPSSSPS